MKYKSFSKIPEDKTLFLPSFSKKHAVIYEITKDCISEYEGAYAIDLTDPDLSTINVINYVNEDPYTTIIFNLSSLCSTLTEAKRELIEDILND